MTNSLIRKLEQFAALTCDERQAIEKAVMRHVRLSEPRSDIFREGDATAGVVLILRGWACRYRMLGDGRRHIISLSLPGDLTDHHGSLLGEQDYSLGSLTPTVVAEVPHGVLEALTDGRPRIRDALRWEALTAASMQREWSLALAQRSAMERVAHLFCELFVRLRAVSETSHRSIAFPLTQTDLADMTGLSSVHVNRTLQELRGLGLIALKEKVLSILDLRRLAEAALFNPKYLHFRNAALDPFIGEPDRGEWRKLGAGS